MTNKHQISNPKTEIQRGHFFTFLFTPALTERGYMSFGRIQWGHFFTLDRFWFSPASKSANEDFRGTCNMKRPTSNVKRRRREWILRYAGTCPAQSRGILRES